MEMGRQIMEELHVGRPSGGKEISKMSLPDAMEKAFEEIGKYIQENSDALHLDLETSLFDLQQYFDAVNKNSHMLTEEIYRKCEELFQISPSL